MLINDVFPSSIRKKLSFSTVKTQCSSAGTEFFFSPHLPPINFHFCITSSSCPYLLLSSHYESFISTAPHPLETSKFRSHSFQASILPLPFTTDSLHSLIPLQNHNAGNYAVLGGTWDVLAKVLSFNILFTLQIRT